MPPPARGGSPEKQARRRFFIPNLEGVYEICGLEVIRRAVAQPDASPAELVQASNGSLRQRQAETFGALWVVDQVAQRLGIKKALGVTREAELSYWQVLARVLRPGTSLLAMVRLAGTCAAAALLGWRLAFTEDGLYANGTWLEGRHAVVERRLWQARPTQPKNQLFLYDVTSSYVEGRPTHTWTSTRAPNCEPSAGSWPPGWSI